MSKETIYLNSKKSYIAIKSACDIVPNLGLIEKLPRGKCDGTLNAKQELIQRISAAGGNFTGTTGYILAINGQTRRVGGAGFEGWRELGSIDNAIAYLQQYFEIHHCDDATCLDIKLSGDGLFIDEVDKGLDVRIYREPVQSNNNRDTIVVVTTIARTDTSTHGIEDFFRRLQGKLKEILKAGVVPEVYLPGGGNIHIPDWFKDWCNKNNIQIRIFDAEGSRLDKIRDIHPNDN
jgi:hypothetical protein